MQTNRKLMGRAMWSTAICSSLAVPMLFASGALAQDQDQQAAEEIEEVVVTGSRIQRANLVSPAPVTQVDSEDITLSGDVNVVDIVDDIPALLTSQNLEDTRSTTGQVGAGILNLRSLGTNRTLVLVDGRRHVAGIAGSATVDTTTIPAGLVDRVEVLTGGASAIYGADAVTGVVNFILKKDYEGFETSAQYNISDNGDGDVFSVSALGGGNFDDGRGNATFYVQYQSSKEIRYNDRSHTRGDRVASDWPNPVFRLQTDDISRFDLDPRLLGGVIDDFCGDGDDSLGAGKSELCGRIVDQPARLIAPFPRFDVSNYGGLLGLDLFTQGSFILWFPGDWGLDPGEDGTFFDFDNDGVEDCFQSNQGTQNQRFGGFAGCHVVNPDGSVRPFRNGIIANDINGWGGDGTFSGRNLTVIPDDQRLVSQANLRYQLFDNVRWFGEAKFVHAKTVFNGRDSVNTFYDSIPIRYENPFIPAEYKAAIDQLVDDNVDVLSDIIGEPFDRERDVTVFMGRDPTDLGDADTIARRDMIRIVTGFEGQIPESTFNYEVSFNYGRTEADTAFQNHVIMDRIYAALDVISDPETGEPICRSDIDPDTPPGVAFLPSFQVWNGFQTFLPGDGQCKPLNFFGVGAPSQEAIDFVTTTTRRQRTLEQFVVSGYVAGDSADWFELPGGPVGVAAGAEYRKETSAFVAGFLENQALVFDPNIPIENVSGKFDVWEIFGEVSMPLVTNKEFFEEVTIDAAVRYGDYSTAGGTTTWKIGGTWAPISDIRLRGTYSSTIRAPNISELFTPLTGTTARPIDPCDMGELNNGSEFRATNCAADGLAADFTDPLTARISGFTGGNPDLNEETAKTWTVGVILQPNFAPGLTITADYYSIRIKDAIAAVGVQEIVNACYDLQPGARDVFCDQITRDSNPGSAFFQGIISFVTSQLNFAAIETAGIDYQVAYQFELGDLMNSLEGYGNMELRVSGNWTDKVDRFEDPTDPTVKNPELYENRQPRHAFNVEARWNIDRLTVNWQARYIGNVLQPTPRLQYELRQNFVNPWAGSRWRNDLSAIYQITDDVTVYAGVNNLFDSKPYLANATAPVGIMGRQFFGGITTRF